MALSGWVMWFCKLHVRIKLKNGNLSSLTYQHYYIRHYKNVIFTSCVQVGNPFHSISRSYSNSSLLVIKLRIQIISNFSIKTKNKNKKSRNLHVNFRYWLISNAHFSFFPTEQTFFSSLLKS